MSGLLLRLAARACGQRSATLHSPAALPFQGVAEQEENPAPAPDRLDPPAERPQAMQQPASRIDRPTAAEQPGSAPRGETAPDPLITPPAAPAFHHPTPAAAPPNGNAAETVSMATSAPLDMPAPAPLVVPGAPMGRPDALERPSAGRSGLLSLSPSPIPQPAAAAPVVATAPGRQADEVHIHIGRIEVTAVQESAPGPHAPRKGRSPLSLEDYLARRKGEGR